MLESLIESGERFLTIHGPGGIGKTRLSVALFENIASAGSPDVHYCNVENEHDISGMCRSIAHSIGLEDHDRSRSAWVGDVESRLASLGAPLLLLDNLEQLLPDAAVVFASWLSRTNASFVVASRHIVGLEGERSIELLPLALRPSTPSGLSPAVQLFVDCVAAHRSGYAPKPTELRQLQRLAEKLDGIPLAIELAAARLRVLSAEALLDRLESQGTSVLAGPLSRRARPGSSPSLRSVISSSWQLLDPAEQSVLMQCSVFRGGFASRAAEAVVELPDADPPVLDVLHCLREKSLLKIEAEQDDIQLGMYDSIRHFAAERLHRSPGFENVRLRHAQWFVARRGPQEPTIDRPSPRECGEPFERDNLCAVLENMMSAVPRTPRHVELALRAAIGLDNLAGGTCLEPRQLSLLAQALEAAHADIDSLTLAEARYAQGRALEHHGCNSDACDALRDALSLAQRSGARHLEARIHTALGGVLDSGFRAREARGELEQAVALFEFLDEHALSCRAACRLGTVLLCQGLLRQAQARFEAAQAGSGHAGDVVTVSWAIAGLGRTALERGDTNVAHAHLCRAVAMAREERAFQAASLFVRWLGLSCLAANDTRHAAEHLSGALEDARRLGVPLRIGASACALAAVLAREGRPEDAMRLAGEALQHTQEHPVWSAIAELYLAQIDATEAQITARAGDTRAARERLGRARGVLARSRHLLVAHTNERLLDVSAEARLARRLLQQMLDAVQREAWTGATQRTDPVPLVVAEGGLWFCLGDAPAVNLRQRGVLQRVLWAICEKQLETPGMAVATSEIVASAWQGERLPARVGASRVYAAVNELRKMGLRDALQNEDGGYSLSVLLRIELG